jgi:hypothetical protein
MGKDGEKGGCGGWEMELKDGEGLGEREGIEKEGGSMGSKRCEKRSLGVSE